MSRTAQRAFAVPRLTLLVLMTATAGLDALAQDREPDLPMFPPREVEWEDRELRRLRVCLEKTGARNPFEDSIFGGTLEIGLPHAGMLCRLRGARRLLSSVEPEDPPDPVRFEFQSVAGLEPTALRLYLADRTREVDVHRRHIGVGRGQAAAIVDMKSGAQALRSAVQSLVDEPLKEGELPSAYAWLASTVPECHADGTDLKKHRQDFLKRHERVALHPYWRRAMKGVSVGGGVVVPVDVRTCERGTTQAVCASKRPIDWNAPCWDPSMPSQKMPCTDEQPAVGGLAEDLSPLGHGCDRDLEERLAPFITRVKPGAQMIIIPRTRARDAGDLRLSEFVDELDLWQPEADAAHGRFVAAWTAAVEKLRPGFDRLWQEFALETAWLSEEGRRLDAALDAVRKLEHEQTTLRARSSDQKQVLAAAGAKIVQADREVLALEKDLAQLVIEVSEASSEVGRRKAALDALQLQCGSGVTYEACPDEGAKLRYDRARYEASERLAEVREALFEKQAARAEAVDQRELARDRRLVARLDVSEVRNDLFETTTRLAEVSERLETDRAAYEKRKALYDQLHRGHEWDERVLRQTAGEMGFQLP